MPPFGCICGLLGAHFGAPFWCILELILELIVGVLFGCLFEPLGAQCGPWGLLELILDLLELILGPFGQGSQRAPKRA